MTCLLAVNWDNLFQPTNIMFMSVFGALGVVAIIAILAATWHSINKHQYNTRLKRDLVARGYTAEEIERILTVEPKDK
jgi:hypothetical protein